MALIREYVGGTVEVGGQCIRITCPSTGRVWVVKLADVVGWPPGP